MDSSSLSSQAASRGSVVLSNFWNNTGSICLRLASRGDAVFHYVTGSVDEAKKRGLIPLDYQCEYGEVFLLLLDRRLCVMRCNRQNGKTFAGNLPHGLVMPQIVGGGLVPQEYEVAFIGSLRGATLEVRKAEGHVEVRTLPGGPQAAQVLPDQDAGSPERHETEEQI